MTFEKFTVKSQESLQKALQLAQEHGHQQVDAEHLAVALLEDPKGVASTVISRLGADPAEMEKACRQEMPFLCA